MHVVFDLDGVLLDSETDLSWLERALDATLREVGLPRTEENRSALFPLSRSSLATLADRANTTSERLWSVRNRHYVDEKVAAIESGQIQAYPDVDAVVELADEYPLAIISNSPQVVVDAFVEEAGLDGIFERTVGRGTELADAERIKPDPFLFERLHAETAADEYLYVGDEESDREFAEATGMGFVHLDREDGPVRTLYDVRDRIRGR